MPGRVRVFVATSVDGFIAGPNDDLSWLPQGGDVEDTFTPFFSEVGAMLMGRRTYDVVSDFEGPWPYGSTPVLVATRRPIVGAPGSVRGVSGSIERLVERAREAAGGRDVYVDGGQIIRAALDAGLVDEMTVTVVSKILGDGVRLFAGTRRQHSLVATRQRRLSPDLVELTYVPA